MNTTDRDTEARIHRLLDKAGTLECGLELDAVLEEVHRLDPTLA